MDHAEQAQEHEARVARLLAELEARRDGESLDPNDIARLVAGEADEEVRAALLARLGSEDAAVVAALTSAAAARTEAAPARRSFAPLAVAAVLLLAVGAWFLFTEGGPRTYGDDDLATAFASLRAADAATFEGIDPLLAEDRAGGSLSVRRGGIRVLAPHDAILELRPTLRWTSVRGAGPFQLEILSDEGEAVLATAAEVSELSWPATTPPLEAGSAYVLRITTTVAGVRVEGSRAFRVPDADAQARYARALDAVEAKVAADLRVVTRAHVALRFDLVAEAARHLEGPVADSAKRLADETRDHVKRRRGED